MPIFDNDYATAMSAFLDQNVTATGGSGLLVDGVEANRATVSASAVQEVRINQDPYSAQYYWPGRGQMEIVTKSAADQYHGQFNFLFRDSALNAQNALAPSKPFEQRQNYEGHITGPIPHRAQEQLSRLLQPRGVRPGRGGERHARAHRRQPQRRLQRQRARAHARHRVQHPRRPPVQRAQLRLRAIQLPGWTGQNQGVGGQTLASAGYNNRYREDDATAHLDSTLSPVRSISSPWWPSTTPTATGTPPRARHQRARAISSPAPRRPTPSPPNTTSASTT